ncbi:hypothetical protein [Streptosporangium saharense]|uniref:hypothetical protein n=1 Tax=Streptosporangium saharense TaxID=1706840 RepID=UPI0036B18E8D
MEVVVLTGFRVEGEFAGVLPAGLTGLPIGARTPFGPFLAVSDVLLTPLRLTFTVAGQRTALAAWLPALTTGRRDL